MYYAQLTINFNRAYDSGLDNYCMETTIQSASTTPVDLWNSLLVRPGSTTLPEMLMRVATKTEIGIYTTVLPSIVDLFTASSLAAISVIPTDVIRIQHPVPPLWSIMDGVAINDEFEITSVLSATEVEVAGGFPDFAYPITFQIWNSAGTVRKLPVGADPDPADGIANRDYGGAPLAYYRASFHRDTFGNSYDAAANQLDSLRALAQGVVNEYNRDDYTGSSTEVFE